MAHEGAGRPLQSGGTDGRGSSTLGRASPTKERRGSAKNGDGTDFPRYFLQLGNDFKRTRGYEMIQELQLMVCNKESGIKGNAARARVMVLLREVQSVLVGLENKIDAQTYEMGVFNVERSELRKELRDEKSKELQPLHTIDFRSTEVKDLPHKLRTLFEDNQVLREQVRSLQYTVRNGEAKLEAAQQKLAALEAENANLSMALREIGVTPDLALEMRHLHDVARGADARMRQADMQAMALQEQLEVERRMLSQQARHFAAKQAMLEARLCSALGVTPSTSRAAAAAAAAAAAGVGAGLGSAASSAVGGPGPRAYGRTNMYDMFGSSGGDDVLYSASFTGMRPMDGPSAAGPAGPGGAQYGTPSLLDGAGGMAGFTGVDGRSSAHSKGPSMGASGGGGMGGGVGGGAGGATSTMAGRSGASGARDQHSSPPRSPSGRSISHSPGSVIPSLYPLFNSKPRATHTFTPESTSWLMTTYGNGTASGGGGGSVRDAAYGTTGGGSMSSVGYATLPPPPTLARTASVSERLTGLGGSGGGSAGPASRPGSSLAGAIGPTGRPGSSMAGPGLEMLPPAGDGPVGQPRRPHSSGSASAAGGGGGPGEAVRAINSTAVVTSRPLLPSVSGGSGRVGPGGALGGGGGGPGILGLRTMLGGPSGSILRRTGDGAGGSLSAAAGGAAVGIDSGGLQMLSPDPGALDKAVGEETAAGTPTGTGAGTEEAVTVADDEAAAAPTAAVPGGGIGDEAEVSGAGGADGGADGLGGGELQDDDASAEPAAAAARQEEPEQPRQADQGPEDVDDEYTLVAS